MFKTRLITILTIISSFMIANELTPAQQEAIGQRALKEFAQAVWTQAMEAKQAYQQSEFRDSHFLSNLASTAPRVDFQVHADLSDEMVAGNPTGTIYVSTDNQSNWYASEDIAPLNTEGFESTWGTTIITDVGQNIAWYLKGEIDSEALGFDYGRLIVTGTPKNENNNFPPGSNLYAQLANDDSGETGSDYDIIGVRGTYNDDRVFVSLDLNGNCCDEGGFFGPWYLYGVGIVNPESESEVAYAIGYGDGGFGQLTPGLLKITGDLATGEIGGFDYITTNINYSTAGNRLQAAALLSYMTDDIDWGEWPNSVNGFIALGVTVEASLDGLDVAASVLDQTNPGLMILQTSFQNGNIDPVLTDPAFDADTSELSITYTDEDGNLPWWKNVQVCHLSGTCENGFCNGGILDGDPCVGEGGECDGPCFLNLPMIPDDHTYLEGVRYTASLFDENIDDGLYEAKFWFSDDMPGESQVHLDITVGDAGTCDLLGDSNGDGNLNVLDVVLLVNIVLAGEFNECADLNGDDLLYVLDIVLLVNIILQG